MNGHAAKPLLRWLVDRGTECVIVAVDGSFEVRLLRDGQLVRSERFERPGPAFETAHSWRHTYTTPPATSADREVGRLLAK